MTYESLKHTRWECKYHVVFIPKYRKKKLFGELRQYMGELFRELAKQKECRIEEGHLMVDHIHMLILIPPKYAVAQVIGFIKGKNAIHKARTCMGRTIKIIIHYHTKMAGMTSPKRFKQKSLTHSLRLSLSALERGWSYRLRIRLLSSIKEPSQ